MKLLVRYLLEGKGEVPKFIEDGGYFPLGEEYVGITVDSSKRHVPSSVHILSKNDLLVRLQMLGFKDDSKNTLSYEQLVDLVDNFLAERGMSDYV